MTFKDLEKHYLALSEIQEKKRNTFSDWLKNIITVATGLLAVLISLKTKKSESILEHYLFIFTIIFIALGILSGVIVLFSDIKVLSLFESKKKEQISQLLDGKNYAIDHVTFPKFYRYLKYFCMISFFMSLILLICYAILSDL
jgi:hypothetical protein